MLIRPAEVRDARGIARVQVRCWQIGYRGIVPDAYLARITIEDSMNMWLASLAALHRMDTLVAEDDEEAISGWAGFGANRSELPTDVGELNSLFVDPDCWETGIGGALLVEAEHSMAAAGFHDAILWTLTVNTRARRFYERRGWELDGATDTHASGVGVVRYVKSLASAVDHRGGAE